MLPFRCDDNKQQTREIEKAQQMCASMKWQNGNLYDVRVPYDGTAAASMPNRVPSDMGYVCTRADTRSNRVSTHYTLTHSHSKKKAKNENESFDAV